MQVERILIIRFRRVGDATLSIALCSSLRKSFPNAKIHYILNENIASLFENHPDIDKIITFSDEELKNTWRYLRKVRKIVKEGKYDVIIDTRSTVKTMPFSILSAKTKYRIGRRKVYNRFIQNHRVNNVYNGEGDNVQLTLSLLDPLTKDFPIEKDPVFKVYITAEEKEKYRQYMESKGVDFTKQVIVSTVTGRLQHKIWAYEKMKEIVRRTLEKYDVQIIFNHAGEREKADAEQIYNELGRHDRIFVDVEAKSLRELVALMANSDFFFGNEGGPRHISQALDLPSFAIYSPSIAKGNWLPNHSEKFRGIELKDINPDWATNNKMTSEEKFDLIDVDSVWKRLDEMYSQMGLNKR